MHLIQMIWIREGSVCKISGGGVLLDNWESLCTRTKCSEGTRESYFCLSFIYLFNLNASASCAYIICLWFNLKLSTDWKPIIHCTYKHVLVWFLHSWTLTTPLSKIMQLAASSNGTFIHMLLVSTLSCAWSVIQKHT